MERLPRRVRLPAGWWRVERAALRGAPGETVWGRCDYARRTLAVRRGIDPALARLTLEHEVVHAILFDAGIELDASVEEAVCNALAAYLVTRGAPLKDEG